MGIITRSFANLITASGPSALPSGVGGKVLQVVSTNKSDTFSMSSLTFADITGLTVSITPSSASNKILVIASLGIVSGTTGYQMFFRMVRDSTNISIPSSAGSRTLCNFGLHIQASDKGTGVGYQILDTPNTTSSITYKVQGAAQTNATLNINGTNGDADADYTARGTSTITVMEIAA